MSAPIIDLAERRFERLVEAIHDLGPRVLGEFLRELGAQHFCQTEIEVALQRYSALDAVILRELGADRWPT
jgi:hypothetical protein